MNKVVLTKEQALALEKWMSDFGVSYHSPKEGMLKRHCQKDNLWGNPLAALNEVSIENLAKALYVGYEVEETAEEKILRMYNTNIQNSKYGGNVGFTSAGIACGIAQTLKALNYKIKGIND